MLCSDCGSRAEGKHCDNCGSFLISFADFAAEAKKRAAARAVEVPDDEEALVGSFR